MKLFSCLYCNYELRVHLFLVGIFNNNSDFTVLHSTLKFSESAYVNPSVPDTNVAGLRRRGVPAGRGSALVVQVEAGVVGEVLGLIDAAVGLDRVGRGGGRVVHRRRGVRLRLQRQRGQRIARARRVTHRGVRVLVPERVAELVVVGRGVEAGERLAAGGRRRDGGLARRHAARRRHRVVVVDRRGVRAVGGHQVRERVRLLRVAVQQELVVERRLAARRRRQRPG